MVFVYFIEDLILLLALLAHMQAFAVVNSTCHCTGKGYWQNISILEQYLHSKTIIG